MAKKANPRKRQVSSRTEEGVVTGSKYPTEEIKWWREAVEGLVIAIVLALLIRGFEAEAFVIPTGSMANTLYGRHKDVICDQCGYNYRAGASYDNEVMLGRVVLTTCPMCAFPKDIDYERARDVAFTGDRILVNKFAYSLLGEPERFDVIVFKNPGNAKQNYIKRLCGLPGETIRLFRGDIYVKKDGETEYTIARKPPKKLKALLQLVHDTGHVPEVLDREGMPPRWQPQPGSEGWSSQNQNRSFTLARSSDANWIRYRHITPQLMDWLQWKKDDSMSDLKLRRGELITDHYAYNSYLNSNDTIPMRGDSPSRFFSRSIGKNWVGDLALECNVEILDEDGELFLDLVEGGWHFRCTVDVATGKATLSINDGRNGFTSSQTVSCQTKIRGNGRHRLFFTNIDNELRLWVDGKLCKFDGDAFYDRADNESFRPFYGGEDDPGDLAPAGIGAQGMGLKVNNMRIHRDVYYVAVQDGQSPLEGDYELHYSLDKLVNILRDPDAWATTPLFSSWRSAEFKLEDSEDDSKDQFFPMGDNSPQSEDARIWRAEPFVERQFLIGEAVVIYWPHPWHAKLPGTSKESLKTLPVFPNVTRMGVIH